MDQMQHNQNFEYREDIGQWLPSRVADMKVLVAIAFVIIIGIGAVKAGAAETWHGLKVEPENSCSTYDSEDYGYNRNAILSMIWLRVGSLYSPYDNMIYTHDQVDVEHRVARHQAHVSGMCLADKHIKTAFAQDLNNLTVATHHMNRVEKSDKDAAGFVPPANRCHFIIAVVRTKCQWGLSVDPAERDAMDGVLQHCPWIEMADCQFSSIKERIFGTGWRT